MNPNKSIETARSPVLRGSFPALMRAAERARQLAAQTGTAVVVVRDGAIEHRYLPFAAPDTPSVQAAHPAYGKSV